MSDYEPRTAFGDHGNRAIALAKAGRRGEAVACMRTAAALNPGSNAISNRVALGIGLATIGELGDGLKEMSCLWPAIGGPWVWRGQRLNGETLLVFSDGAGYGDTIQFSRYASMPAARGARVVMKVGDRAQRLIRGIDGVAEVFSTPELRLPPRVYHLPVMELPRVFDTTLETIPASVPYIRGDTTLWRDFLDNLPGLKVGICWAGHRSKNPMYAQMDAIRSVRLIDIAPLLSVPDCSFVSLQFGPPATQMRELPEDVVLHDVEDRQEDWQATADLVSGLDLVISVDTAVCHLAGALGRPVWLLNPYETHWTWMLDRTDSPWYPTMRIFRQSRPGDWGGVVANVKKELGKISVRRSEPLVSGGL